MNGTSGAIAWTEVLVLTLVVALLVVTAALFWEGWSRWRRGRDLREKLADLRGERPGGETVSSLLKDREDTPDWLNAILQWLPQTRDLDHFLEQADVQWTPGTYVLLTLGLSAVFGVGSVAAGLPVELALLLAAGAASLPYLYVKRQRTRRFRSFEEAFPDAIDLLGRSVRAGHAMTTGLSVVGTETPEPVAGEFRQVFEEQKYGLPLRDSLLSLGDRIDLPDVRIFVTSLLVQREAGGNLVESLDSLADVMRARFRLRREIRTHTAQGRMTGYLLGAIPILIGLLLYTINPEYMGVLVREPAGRTLLAVALGMQMFGYLIIRRIVNLDY